VGIAEVAGDFLLYLLYLLLLHLFFPQLPWGMLKRGGGRSCSSRWEISPHRLRVKRLVRFRHLRLRHVRVRRVRLRSLRWAPSVEFRVSGLGLRV